MSHRNKTALRKIDQRIASLATRHVDPDEHNVRAAAVHFAGHLRTLKPLDLKQLGDEPERLELLANDFFQNHAPALGVEPRKDPKAGQQSLAKAQDESLPAFGLGGRS